MPDDDIVEGVYFIINKASRTLIDLPARDNQFNKVVGYAFGLLYPHFYDHQHWLIRKDGQNRAYTIQNIGNGKMLESVGQGLKKIGVQATCSARNFQGEPGLASQEWFLKPEDNGWYTLLNSGNQTVLEIANGSSENHTAVQSWARNTERKEQLWRLERRSRTSTEIVNILGNAPPFNTSAVSLENILADVGREWRPIEYVILLEGFRTGILLDSGWMNQELAPRGRQGYLDFARGTQNAIQTKAGERIGVPGVKVLFGIVEGETKGEKKAYNWTLTQDLCSVIFLEPQTGREYTTRWIELEGFSPTSVLC